MGAVRDVADFYDEPGVQWMLREAGTHLHPGREDATVALAARAEAFGFPGGGRVLELASALAGPARYLARRFGARILCIDGNPRMHAAALTSLRYEGLALRVNLLLARTERLPLGPATCDGAWSQDALCHMDKPAVVAEAARVLRPGSVFAFTDWIARGVLTADQRSELARLWGFPSVLRLADYVALLDSAGFEVLVAEDRTPAISAPQYPRPDDQARWEQAFAARYGEAELTRQQTPNRYWRELVGAGHTGYGLFIARRRGERTDAARAR